MEPTTAQTTPPVAGSTGRHEKLLTEVIQKQMALLGSNIALGTARSVPGITVTDDGVVTSLSGDHQQLTQQLVEQFMTLSGLIVKKTLEPLLAGHTESSVSKSVAQQSAAQAQVDQAINQYASQSNQENQYGY